MKITKFIKVVRALLFTSGFLCACNSPSASNEEQKAIPEESAMEAQENPFMGLREMALNVTPEQLELELPEGEISVYGIVMDWSFGDAIVTVSAYETGDASMYLSSGGGVIGGGQHDNVRQVVVPYVELGQEILAKARKTESTSLPNKNTIQFYLLTNNGTFFVEDEMRNIENETSEFLPLFEQANAVLSELRMT